MSRASIDTRIVVIAGNLGNHKGPRAPVHPQRRRAPAGPAPLLYSPDLNPIEVVFTKPQVLFRNADERSVEVAWSGTGFRRDAFTPSKCQNHFQCAGYVLT